MSITSHLVPLSEDWSLWRHGCLRSAGFPAALVAPLATEATAAAADAVLEAERTVQQQRELLLRAVDVELTCTPSDVRKALQHLRKQLLRGLMPTQPPSAALLDAWQKLRSAHDTLTSVHEAWTEAWPRMTRSARTALREIATDPQFRAALLWQNRRALQTGVASLLRQPSDAHDFKTRQNEALVTSYAQRYAMKNESIGFFGPVAWASFELSGPALLLQPTTPLIAAREVFFEFWGIHALAAHFCRDLSLRRFLAPRLAANVRVDGAYLHYPIARRTRPSGGLLQLLCACDGQTSALQIAERLVGRSDEFPSLDAVFDALDHCHERGILSWQLELAAADSTPERQLRVQLARIPNNDARREALAVLDELSTLRAELAAAATDEERLAAGFSKLDAAFTRVTGENARRADGAQYAGRALVYEECRRNVDLAIGPLVRQRLAAPLALVLTSARWYTHRLATRYLALLTHEFQALAAETGQPALDFLQFFKRCSRHFNDNQHQPSATVQATVAELTQLWAELLPIDPSARRVVLDSRKIAAQARERFAVPGPGWPTARYHSPDIMIATRDVHAAERGEFLLVLGELHAGGNTLCVPVFARQHPDPSELQRALDADLPAPRVRQVVAQEHATRLFPSVVGSDDYELEIATSRSARPQVLRAANLLVESTPAGLQVRTRDHGFATDLIAFMEGYLLFDALAHFRMLSAQPHMPRVCIDDLVVSRESWRLSPSELTFAACETPAERFLAARRLQVALALPRHVFIKTPEELKPVYVDFDSAPLVELLARTARKASALTVSEMLPTPEQLWLRDSDDQAYVCELRVAAVDHHTYSPIDPTI